MSDVDLPELPVPDERRIRRARRRGIARTAVLAVVWVLLGSLLLQLLNGAYLATGSREDRFMLLAQQGFEAAHPELGGDDIGFGCCDLGLVPGRASAFHEVSPWTAGRDAGEDRVVLHRQVDGDVSVDLPSAYLDTPIGSIAGGEAPSKPVTTALLDQLPAAVRLLAVVTFAEPLDAAGRAGIEATFGQPLLFTGRSYLTDPYAVPRQAHAPQDNGGLVTWRANELDGFAAFARRWTSADDGNLRAVGLPDSAVLRRLAEEPRIRAVASELTPAEARALLADGRVAAVHVVDAALAVTPGA